MKLFVVNFKYTRPDGKTNKAVFYIDAVDKEAAEAWARDHDCFQAYDYHITHTRKRKPKAALVNEA